MNKRPKCIVETCSSLRKQKGYKKDGSRHLSKYCSMHDRAKYGDKVYKLHKGNSCSFCGFIPVHSCQLDVDHIDGNHKNNDPTNLQTLCANCHRLKTHINKDSHKKDPT